MVEKMLPSLANSAVEGLSAIRWAERKRGKGKGKGRMEEARRKKGDEKRGKGQYRKEEKGREKNEKRRRWRFEFSTTC